MRIDQSLVERIEASGAAISVAHVEAVKRLHPAAPADWAPLGTGALIATGRDRYVNRAVGATVRELGREQLDALESFYLERELDPMVELSSWAPPSTVAALRERGFGIEWFRSMFAVDPRTLASAAQVEVIVEEVDDATVPSWLEVLAIGHAIDDHARRMISDEHALANRTATGVTGYVARIDGAVAGCGSLHALDGVAWVGGAATHPQFRRRGVQSALLHHRIRVAASIGCDLVAATALSSGGSARNLGRLGFTLVQTQAVVARRR